MRYVVSTWYGTFLRDGVSSLRSALAPVEVGAIATRARRRREGSLTPEEETLLREPGSSAWHTRDRRLAEHGLVYDPDAPMSLPAPSDEPDRRILASALLEDAERALIASWDPSVHVQEAVRAAADLDRVRNLVGERLGSWVAHDFPDLDPGDHTRAAVTAIEGGSPAGLGPTEPGLLDARRKLGELYRTIADVRRTLQDAVNLASPVRTPNLTSLLGPELAARMVAQAGGLDRLARLPSSTVQVLGAERAFFEHLRGRAPPPRHGLLFVHPAIQSAPRAERGKLARALAGKVAIAARLDHAGAPVHAQLAAAFESRRVAIRSRKGRTQGGPRTDPGEVSPST